MSEDLKKIVARSDRGFRCLAKTPAGLISRRRFPRLVCAVTALLLLGQFVEKANAGETSTTRYEYQHRMRCVQEPAMTDGSIVWPENGKNPGSITTGYHTLKSSGPSVGDRAYSAMTKVTARLLSTKLEENPEDNNPSWAQAVLEMPDRTLYEGEWIAADKDQPTMATRKSDIEPLNDPVVHLEVNAHRASTHFAGPALSTEGAAKQTISSHWVIIHERRERRVGSDGDVNVGEWSEIASYGEQPRKTK